MATTNIGPVPYGTVIPTSGLYNGYRFAYFNGNNVFELLYRIDLDGAYPWYVVGGTILENNTTGSTASVTVPRAGVWLAWGGGYSAVSSLGDSGITPPNGNRVGFGNTTSSYGSITTTKTAGSTFTTTRDGTNDAGGFVSVAAKPLRII